MPLIRKRRAAEASPSPPPMRRRSSPSPSNVSSGNEGYDDGNTADGETQGTGGNYEQMVKKLVRLALASEYSRQPIRRSDITAKVMSPNTGRQFKHIFEQANDHLRSTFGCEMTELPQKEKVTISQKRAAQRTQTQNPLSSSSKSYILTSTIPASLRTPTILPPPAVPTSASESAYVGLYTFILALIYISPGQSIPESRLEKQLKRMNADNYVLSGEKTEKVLKKMEKEGYILKVRERDGGGEETVDYMVGPRGKAEVGEKGVAGLIRKVWGKLGPERVDLERRLVRSLGDGVELKGGRKGTEEAEEDGEEQTQTDGEEGEAAEDQGEDRASGRRRTSRGAPKPPARRTSGRRGRNALVEDEADGEDDVDEEEEEEEDAESEDE